MSEQSSGLQTGEIIADATRAQHGDDIAARISKLVEYGPLRIVTHVPDIPGVEYRKPYRRDADQQTFASIGSTALSVLSDESGVKVAVHSKDQKEPFILLPEQVENVYVDHPHSSDMPLRGQSMMAISLTKRDGVSVLRWPNHVIEFGYRDRIDTENHPDYPGISIVRAYKADDGDIWASLKERKIASLEDAKQADDQPRTFLITKIDDENYVVTSRIGYEETTPVTVRRPKHPGNEPLLHIEMLDMNKDTSDEELLENHLKRYRNLSQRYLDSPRRSMKPFELDSVFLYMVHD